MRGIKTASETMSAADEAYRDGNTGKAAKLYSRLAGLSLDAAEVKLARQRAALTNEPAGSLK